MSKNSGRGPGLRDARTIISTYWLITLNKGFPGGSVVKNLPGNAGDMGSVPWSGRSLGKRNGNPLQYSCLGNPLDRGVWQVTVHAGGKESDIT